MKHPEPSHKLEDVISMSEFINLLKEEEDYWTPDQTNTKLMITKLRKIFYDEWGWSSELIKGAAAIPQRYVVQIVDTPSEHTKVVRRYVKHVQISKHREVTYGPNDRVYGNSRVGTSPFIYKTDHQEVILPDGTYCDAAHILAGLDAYNYLAMVTPLPSWLGFIAKLFPHVDSNVDIVTWLGDIASSSVDFLMTYKRDKERPLSVETEQKYINRDAPGSDMLGDIEPYVIAKNYDVGSTNGKRYTDILEDYYFGTDAIRSHRFSIYAAAVGLKNFNGTSFANERDWMTYYKKQLRDNCSFQAFSLTDETSLKSIWLPLMIWLNGHQDVLKLELLLEIYLKTLKEEINKEPKK